jgi:double stranded RNA-specific editase B
MSEKGLALNDCHAEILATRCLRDFLYTQIDMVNALENPAVDEKPDAESLILENFGTDSEGVTKYKLKEDVKFHLYISTSPCGDAR